MRILVAEDDQRITDTLRAGLEGAGFVVEIESDGEIAWHRGDTENFDAIILDLGLPTLDGMTILKRWRKGDRRSPVLVLSARGRWDERVDGIEEGADDYMVKPFKIEEVVARTRAIIRRAGGLASSVIEAGELVVNARTMQVLRNGIPIRLTPQEYRLVAFLAHRNGQVVSPREIAEHLYHQDLDRDSNAIEVLVGRVRRRLGEGSIITRRGLGYCLGCDEDA